MWSFVSKLKHIQVQKAVNLITLTKTDIEKK